MNEGTEKIFRIQGGLSDVVRRVVAFEKSKMFIFNPLKLGEGLANAKHIGFSVSRGCSTELGRDYEKSVSEEMWKKKSCMVLEISVKGFRYVTFMK